MLKTLSTIPGITARLLDRTHAVVTATDGYTLHLVQSTHAGRAVWRFAPGSAPPTRPAHFVLRHHVHRAANPCPWQALTEATA